MNRTCKIFFFGLIALIGSGIFGRAAFANVRIAFDSSSLNFGDVSLTGSKLLTLEMWDTAGVDITVDRFTISGNNAGDFNYTADSLTPFPLRADSGNNVKIYITFSPSATGPRVGFLQVETSDGTVFISLSGVGGEKSSLAWSLPSIDFGVLGPDGRLDTIVQLHSTGKDSALVAAIEIASADVCFSAQTVSGIQPPFKIAAGDSVGIILSFQGILPLGQKGAQIIVHGATQNDPECDLTGIVEYGAFEIVPANVDFGNMYAGEVRDTTILLENTSEVSIAIEDIAVDPSGDDFTLIDPVATQLMIPAGGSIPLTIRANPGLTTSHVSQIYVVSQSSDPNFESGDLTVSVTRPSLVEPPNQSLSYFCAVSAPQQLTLPISDTGSGRIVFTDFVSNDSNLVLTTNPVFPDTLTAGEAQSVTIQFDPSKVAVDTLVFYGLGGKQNMITDTVALQPMASHAATAISFLGTPSTADGKFEVVTTTSLAPFNIDTIIVHISVGNTDVATLSQSDINLSPSAPANAMITSILPEPGGYAVTIASPTPITASSLLTVGFNRFVTTIDSSNVFVAIETPEKEGCLDWAIDTTIINGAAVCGKDLLQDVMGAKPLILSAVLRENPLSGSNANITILANAAITQARYSVVNAVGESVSIGTFDLSSGQNDREFSISGLPTGVYFLRISTPEGYSTELRLLKID